MSHITLLQYITQLQNLGLTQPQINEAAQEWKKIHTPKKVEEKPKEQVEVFEEVKVSEEGKPPAVAETGTTVAAETNEVSNLKSSSGEFSSTFIPEKIKTSEPTGFGELKGFGSNEYNAISRSIDKERQEQYDKLTVIATPDQVYKTKNKEYKYNFRNKDDGTSEIVYYSRNSSDDKNKEPEAFAEIEKNTIDYISASTTFQHMDQSIMDQYEAGNDLLSLYEKNPDYIAQLTEISESTNSDLEALDLEYAEIANEFQNLIKLNDEDRASAVTKATEFVDNKEYVEKQRLQKEKFNKDSSYGEEVWNNYQKHRKQGKNNKQWNELYPEMELVWTQKFGLQVTKKGFKREVTKINEDWQSLYDSVIPSVVKAADGINNAEQLLKSQQITVGGKKYNTQDYINQIMVDTKASEISTELLIDKNEDFIKESGFDIRSEKIIPAIKHFLSNPLQAGLAGILATPEIIDRSDKQKEMELYQIKRKEALGKITSKEGSIMQFQTQAENKKKLLQALSKQIASGTYVTEDQIKKANRQLAAINQTHNQIIDLQKKKYKELDDLLVENKNADELINDLSRNYNLLPIMIDNTVNSFTEMGQGVEEIIYRVATAPREIVAALDEKFDTKKFSAFDNVWNYSRNLILDTWSKKRDVANKNVDKFQKDLMDGVADSMSIEDIRDADDFGRYLFATTGAIIPQIGVMVATGGFGVGIVTAQAGGQKFKQYEQEMLESKKAFDAWNRPETEKGGSKPVKKPGETDEYYAYRLEVWKSKKPEEINYNLTQMWGGALTMMGAEAVMGRLISLPMINRAKAFTPSRVKRGWTKAYIDSLKSRATTYGVDVVSEGLEEVFTEVAANLYDRKILGKDVNLFDGAPDNFFSGLLMANGFKTPALFAPYVNAASTPGDKINVQERQSLIKSKINSLAQNPNMSKESKLALETEIADLTLELNNDIVLVMNRYSDMPREQIDELGNIEQQTFQIDQQIQTIQSDTNFVFGKEKEIEQLKNKRNNLTGKKNSLLEPYVTKDAEGRITGGGFISPKTRQIDAGARVIAGQLDGVGVESVSDTESLLSVVATVESSGGEVIGLQRDTDGNVLPAEQQGYGVISRLPDGSRQVIINQVSAAKDNIATTTQHEVLHAFLDQIFVNDSAAKTKAGKALNDFLQSDSVNLDQNLQNRFDQYKADFDAIMKNPNSDLNDKQQAEERYFEEIITLTSEGLTANQIQENAAVEAEAETVGDVLSDVYSENNQAALNISFDTGKGVLDFVRGFNQAVEGGKGLTQQQLDLASSEGSTTQQDKARTSEQAPRNKKLMQDIVEGDIGAATTLVQENSGLILDLLKFNPDVAQQSGVDSNDVLQAVTDMMTPGMVDITFKGRKKSLAEEYAQDKGEVSTFLGRLGVRAAEIYTAAGLDPNKFVTESTSGSEARQIASKKTTTTKPKARARTTPKASRKYPSTILGNLGVSTKAEVDALFEEAIADDIANFYKGEIKEFKDIKDIGPAVAALMEKATGLKANRFSKKNQNIMKGDVVSGAVTALQQFLNINAEADFAMLAEAANIEGKSTSIPGKILEALFTKNSKDKYVRDTRKGLKDYKNIIDALNPEAKKAKGMDAVYRSSNAQALKGLANLSLRNLIFEQAVPDPVARTRTGARFSNKIIKEAVDEVENKGAKKFLEKTLSGNLDADQIAQEINKIEDIAKVLGIDFTDVVDYLFTNEKRYKELRSKFDVRVGGKNEISSLANAARLKKGYTSLIKGMIPKGKSFSDLPVSFQMALMKTVGFGDARIKIGGKPFTLQEYGLKRGEYGKLMQAVFGKDALIGTGTNLGTRDNVYAPSNWGEKGFRGKVEKIADSYNNGDITLDEARAKVEDLLTPDKETNIDDVLIANQRAVSDTYVSLINMFAADPTNENFATIIDILESQVNRATGIFKGLIPVTSFSIKPEKGTTKGKTANKRMHNEHLVELFNANKNFLNILDKLRKGTITKEKAIFDAKVNAASLEQAVISERMRVEKDADGASVRSFADPLTFLGKDAQFQIPIGTRRLPSGRIFTGTNLAEFIAQELSEKQAKIISIASDASLSPEGIIVKNMINNKSTYQGAKKQNTEMMPGPLGYARASQKQKTNQDIVGELSTLDQALNEGRKIDKPVRKIRVFDFDDTLARSNSKVIVNMPISSIDKDMLDIVARRKFKKEFENLPSRLQGFNSLNDSQKLEVLKEVPGGTKEINATQFAEQAADLEAQGATFDFSQFEQVIDGKKGPLFDVAKKIADKRGTEDLFILTARPQTADGPIRAFMKALGVDIPLGNITGLGDGTAAAKGRWIAGKAAEGYNDFYFADDAGKNVKAVKEVLDQIDVKSKVQQARASKKQTFDTVVNDMIQDSSGIESYKTFSAAKAKTVGRDKGRFDWLTMASSAEDFKGLLYSLLGNGKKGEAQYEFLKTNLIDPYNKAEDSITQAKISAANDFMALKEQFPGLPKTLETETGVGKFTYQHALRTYMWTQQGMSIPGLSKTDVKKLNKFITDDAKLQAFADQLISIQKGKPYPKPGKDWLGGNLTTDIIGGINDVNRKEYQQEWQENVDIIFSPENLNKMEAAYGTRWRKALENTLTRMKAGTNRLGYNDQTSAVLDWVNNSVGAVMFLNTKSALLQTISAVNFINWGDNNIIAAGKAFANQKQFWGDFMTLMNSDYLVQRRNGLKINVSESEIADAVKDSKNKVKAAIAFLLSKGFVLTRYADSLAIASGGATFYRNRLNKYIKEGMDPKLAQEQAFQDFRQIAEESQQSSSPDKISMQQASAAGRVILNWANTPMQYVRIQKRALQDIIAGRGDAKVHMSRIAYYGVIQNLIFNAMQQALFAIGFGDDEEDEEKSAAKKKQDNNRIARAANGMIDSQLKGLGIAGAGMVAVKNTLMKIYEESGKQRPEYEKAAIEALSFSPAISSKYRKIVGGLKSFSWNMKEIKEKGFSLDNPAYLAGAQIITAVTNIPIDRVIKKANNIRGILSEQSQKWQKVLLFGGWSTWDVGLPYYGGWDKPVEPTEAERKKQEIDVMKRDTNTAEQTQMLLDLGLDKKQIKALRYEDARVKKIIELQNKNKDGKNKT